MGAVAPWGEGEGERSLMMGTHSEGRGKEY